MASKARITDKVRLLIDVMSDFEGKQIAKGQIGTVVNLYFGPERYQVSFATDEKSAVDAMAYCSVTLKPDQFELASGTPPPPKKSYTGGMREIE